MNSRGESFPFSGGRLPTTKNVKFLLQPTTVLTSIAQTVYVNVYTGGRTYNSGDPRKICGGPRRIRGDSRSFSGGFRSFSDGSRRFSAGSRSFNGGLKYSCWWP